MSLTLKGLGVALATPFNKDLSIDFEALGALVDYQIEGGADFIVVLGTTGEAVTLTEAERTEITRFVANRTAQRVPLVLGIVILLIGLLMLLPQVWPVNLLDRPAEGEEKAAAPDSKEA